MKLKYFSVLATLLGTLALENINVEGMRQDDLSKPISYSDWKEDKKGNRAFTNVKYDKKDMEKYLLDHKEDDKVFLKKENVVLEEGIASIEDECFRFCVNLSTITIPSSVKSIGNDCFYGCSNLSTINIPTSVSSIGTGCFGRCSNLSTINIPTIVSFIGEECFYKCSNLTAISTPQSNVIKLRNLLPGNLKDKVKGVL